MRKPILTKLLTIALWGLLVVSIGASVSLAVSLYGLSDRISSAAESSR